MYYVQDFVSVQLHFIIETLSIKLHLAKYVRQTSYISTYYTLHLNTLARVTITIDSKKTRIAKQLLFSLVLVLGTIPKSAFSKETPTTVAAHGDTLKLSSGEFKQF